MLRRLHLYFSILQILGIRLENNCAIIWFIPKFYLYLCILKNGHLIETVSAGNDS